MTSTTMPAPIPIGGLTAGSASAAASGHQPETSAQGRRRSGGNPASSNSNHAPSSNHYNHNTGNTSVSSNNNSHAMSTSIGRLSGQNDGVGSLGMSFSYGNGNTPGIHPMSLSNSYGKDGYGSSFKFLAGTSSGSYRGAMPMSFGKDVKDMMDYSLAQFGTSASSETQIIAPSSMRDSTSSTAQKLEATFCRNFSCCDQELEDLHDLLQHYEECHVKFDDLDELAAAVGGSGGSAGSGNGSGSGETPPAMMPDEGSSDETSSSSSPASPSNLAAGGASGHLKHHQQQRQNSGLLSAASASAATPMATPNAASSGHRKRSFNQFSTTPSAQGSSAAAASAVHQHLRRALADGGIGSAAAAVRRAASPFSTPGGSMPGTPAGEPELDGLLGGNSTIGAFSALSLRSGQFEEHNLPSCAPPTLFFPANGTTSANGGTGSTLSGSTTNQPPHAKRERLNSSSSIATDGGSGGMTMKDFDPKNVIILPGNVDKPYKCPAAGCDKAYKQMNGLKYHRLHGHCNQNNAPISSLQTSSAQLAALVAAREQQEQSSNGNGSAANSPTTANASPKLPTASTINTPTSAVSVLARPTFVSGVGIARASTPGASSSSAAAAAAAAAGTLTPTSTTAPNSPFSANAAPLPSSPAPSPSILNPAGGGLHGNPLAMAPPGSPAGSSSNAANSKILYICQVGTCGKTYKNLNGLRYHYMHSGPHGLLGLQVLHTHGGGNSAKMGDDGKALISTDTLKPEEVAHAARLAAEESAKKSNLAQKTVDLLQAQALAGGGPGHNHKQSQQLEEVIAAEIAREG